MIRPAACPASSRSPSKDLRPLVGMLLMLLARCIFSRSKHRDRSPRMLLQCLRPAEPSLAAPSRARTTFALGIGYIARDLFDWVTIEIHITHVINVYRLTAGIGIAEPRHRGLDGDALGRI
jgi:hypothetical protein